MRKCLHTNWAPVWEVGYNRTTVSTPPPWKEYWKADVTTEPPHWVAAPKMGSEVFPRCPFRCQKSKNWARHSFTGDSDLFTRAPFFSERFVPTTSKNLLDQNLQNLKIWFWIELQESTQENRVMNSIEKENRNSVMRTARSYSDLATRLDHTTRAGSLLVTRRTGPLGRILPIDEW